MNTALKQAIHEAGYTVSDFAEMMGYSHMAIYKWIYDQSTPDVYTAILVAEKLGVSVYDIFKKERG